MKNSLFNRIKNFFIYNTSAFRRKKISSSNISIISNNCWGGMVSKSFNLPFNSPTIGLFFTSDDYLKFLEQLRYYLDMEIEFIDFSESKNAELFHENQDVIDHPIGKLDDIEVYFVHYKTKEEALEKWNRRKKRVNFDNLLIKISEQNFFSVEHLSRFTNLPYDNKVAFVGSSDYSGKDVINVGNFDCRMQRDVDINEEPKTGKIVTRLLNGGDRYGK